MAETEIRQEQPVKKELSGPPEFLDYFMSERQKKLSISNGAMRTLIERATAFLNQPNVEHQTSMQEAVEKTLQLSLELLISVTESPVDLIEMEGLISTQDKMLAFYGVMQELIVMENPQKQAEAILKTLSPMRL